jgi:kynureninase
MNRAAAEQLDVNDPLRAMRERFELPESVVYLDGNSLGALPRRVVDAVARTVKDDWGAGLVRSWNGADWIGLPSRVGALIAPLIGAQPDQVIACDSTTINIHKLVSAATQLRPGRDVFVCERTNFPSDSYAVHRIAATYGATVLEADADDMLDVIEQAGSRLAVVELTHVHYKTGRMHDMRAVTDTTHRHGGLTVWDLAHSAGAVPVELDACGADFALGCGYKFLNGGPGAPAFAYVADRHLANVENVLPGWMGHAQPFDFTHTYTAAPDIRRMLTGTPYVLSMVALEAALLDWADVDINAVRAKSIALSELFIDLVAELDHHGFGLASPRNAALRGSQVSLTHPEGYAIMQALIDRGVIGDFRAPDILRFGLTPLYTRFVDVWDACDALGDVMRDQTWNDERYQTRKAVT